VPFGKLMGYAGDRSNGCTNWSPADAEQMIARKSARRNSGRQKPLSPRSPSPRRIIRPRRPSRCLSVWPIAQIGLKICGGLYEIRIRLAPAIPRYAAVTNRKIKASAFNAAIS